MEVNLRQRVMCVPQISQIDAEFEIFFVFGIRYLKRHGGKSAAEGFVFPADRAD